MEARRKKNESKHSTPTRERIKAVGRDLYVLRGYDGFSFGDVAAVVDTTRANIHHHFGSKSRLMDELIEEFVADAVRRIEECWTRGHLAFADRLERQLADLRTFYARYNPKAGDRNVWSPLSRLRLDLPVLGKPVRAALEQVDRAYDAALRSALTSAIESGELMPSTPVGDVARLLRVCLLSCAPMTQDTGSFREIELLFATLARVILATWGRKKGRVAASRVGV